MNPTSMTQFADIDTHSAHKSEQDTLLNYPYPKRRPCLPNTAGGNVDLVIDLTDTPREFAVRPSACRLNTWFSFSQS